MVPLLVFFKYNLLFSERILLHVLTLQPRDTLSSGIVSRDFIHFVNKIFLDKYDAV